PKNIKIDNGLIIFIAGSVVLLFLIYFFRERINSTNIDDISNFTKEKIHILKNTMIHTMNTPIQLILIYHKMFITMTINIRISI
ncbi:hypothetical protein, partial [Campylobacter sp. W0066.2]|uniref:hypothetical protein n=1 Tax=Campylobacter sp. W0066.2 TaxID=2735752 RepID=UPI002A5600EC|nr:hypothetical protein [Campylobacter sp. W0066.2]